ncbi:MAG: hypothetical protein JWL71_1671 [Acidobacteria bacterium]|nr:hypothetical protein [Acidobacteriota bacterium]
MSASRSHIHSGHRLALMAWAMAASLLAVPAVARAQTIVGYLSNFDAVNDTEGEKQGFEIELEGVQASDITRVFGQAGATCYIRYCIGSVIDVPVGIDPVTGLSKPAHVSIRWTANYDAAAKQFTTPLHAPGGGTSGTPSRVGVLNAPLVNGEQCWSFGLGGAYPVSGCEHFGISTAPGKNPTKTTYRWLVGDPATGAITPAVVNVAVPGVPTPVAVYAPPVPIPHPVAIVNALGQVEAAIEAPRPVPAPAAALAHRYGKAQWVKVYKTELDRNADLDELVGGHPNHVIEIAKAAPVETEWKLLQFDSVRPTNGSSQLVSRGNSGSSHAVVRRYEFYKYTGPVVPPGQTTGGGGNGGGGGGNGGGGNGGGATPTLSTDDQEASLCPRDAAGECTAPGPNELGDYIGAQMAAQNLGGGALLIDQTITFTLPATAAYGDADFTVIATGGGSGNPVLLAASGACANTATAGVLKIVGTGTCLVTATQAGNGSFSPAPPVTLSVVVAKGSATVTFDAGTLHQIYTGTVKTVSTSTTPVALAVDVVITGTPQGAGSYPVTATITDVNYTGSAIDTLVIDKADATFSISAYAGVYDGAAHSATGSATGVQLESLSALLHLGASFTAVPGGIADWTFDGDANYNASNGAADVAITPAPSTVSVTCSSPALYTGSALTACRASASGVALTTVDVSALLAYTANTNAGTATATASYPGDANHSGSTGSNSFVITAAASAVTVSCPAAVVFTGSPLTPCTAAATGAGGLNVPLVVNYLANTNPGTAAATASFAGDANHTGSSGANSFVISAPPPPPPPVGISIAPIPDQTNREGDEVELQVVVVRGAAPTVSAASATSKVNSVDDGDAVRGSFSAPALAAIGLKIDNDGEISGKIKTTSATAAYLVPVTVSYMQNGVTVYQRFVWKITPARTKSGKG